MFDYEGSELDKKITEAIAKEDIDSLKELIGLDDDVIKEIKEKMRILKNDRYLIKDERENFMETLKKKGLISDENLKKIFIAKDKTVLGLTDYKILKNQPIVYLKLEEEFAVFNSEIETNTSVDIVTGKDKEGRDVVLYYYFPLYFDGIIRQERIKNEHGDTTEARRQIIYSDGSFSDVRSSEISYEYDEQGKKVSARGEDDIYGITEYKYAAEGNVTNKRIIKPKEVQKQEK